MVSDNVNVFVLHKSYVVIPHQPSGHLVVLTSIRRNHVASTLIKKYFFLTRELSLINTCCWKADHAILIHDGASRSELIFVYARQHMC